MRRVMMAIVLTTVCGCGGTGVDGADGDGGGDGGAALPTWR